MLKGENIEETVAATATFPPPMMSSRRVMPDPPGSAKPEASWAGVDTRAERDSPSCSDDSMSESDFGFILKATEWGEEGFSLAKRDDEPNLARMLYIYGYSSARG